jgi:prolipoprotein diacylglyceryltransferase
VRRPGAGCTPGPAAALRPRLGQAGERPRRRGQGLPADTAWATAYVGPGPWASLAPEIASHPSQVYEAIATTLVIVLIGLGLRLGAFGRRDGAALLTGVALWAIARGVVAFTWRDAAVAGPFRAEHLVLAVVVVGCIAGLLRLRTARLRPHRTA